MIFTHRHILRMALLVIPLCLVLSGVGLTQDKTETFEEKAESPAVLPPRPADPDSFGNFGSASGLYPAATMPAERLIQSKNIMISWSKDNDELRGFSQKTGEWTNLKIEKQEKLDPTVGSDVAAVRVGDTMAAYSGTTGTWDVLKLSKDSPAEPVIHATHVQTTDNDYLYTFAASKGKWTSPNDPEFRPSTSEYRVPYGVVTPDLGSSPFGGPPEKKTEYDTEYRPYPIPLPVPVPEKSFDTVARKLAQRFRSEGVDKAEARKALTKVVASAFEQRQKQQTTEADRLAEKLKQIRDSIEKRNSLRDKIIERRVDELLDPNVEWDKFVPERASSIPGPLYEYPEPGR